MKILEQRVYAFAALWFGTVLTEDDGWLIVRDDLGVVVNERDGLEAVYDGTRDGVSGKDVLEIADLWGRAGLMVVA